MVTSHVVPLSKNKFSLSIIVIMNFFSLSVFQFLSANRSSFFWSCLSYFADCNMLTFHSSQEFDIDIAIPTYILGRGELISVAILVVIINLNMHMFISLVHWFTMILQHRVN